MDEDTRQKIIRIEERVDAIFVSVEKTRKYIFWSMMGTIILFVLPLIAMLFILPSLISSLGADVLSY